MNGRSLLLTEFEDPAWLLRGARFLGYAPSEGISRWRCPSMFFLLALVSVGLSIACHSAVILVHLQGARDVWLEMGYWYQLDAGPMYLFCAPVILWFGLWMIDKFQMALDDLCSRNILSVEQELPPDFVNVRETNGSITPASELGAAAALATSPLQQIHAGDIEKARLAIARANRRVFNKVILAGLVLLTLGAVFLQELPPKNDRKHLMFGFVQADYIATYNRGLLDSPASESHGRKIGWPVSAILGPREQLRLVDQRDCPTRWRVPLFRRVFLPLALLTQALFAILAWWIFLKIVFFYFLIASAMEVSIGNLHKPSLMKRLFRRCVSSILGSPIIFKLDPEDDSKRFGLTPVLECFRRVGWFMVPLGVAGFMSVSKFYSALPNFDWADAKAMLVTRPGLSEVIWTARGPSGCCSNGNSHPSALTSVFHLFDHSN